VVAACEMAFEASESFDAALAFGFLALQVLAGGGVAASPGDRDDMQRPVDLPVAATIEAMTVFCARMRRGSARHRPSARNEHRYGNARRRRSGRSGSRRSAARIQSQQAARGDGGQRGPQRALAAPLRL
jgi:hypothetical protein